MRSSKYPHLWLQDFKRFGSKTSYHLVNTGPGWYIGNGDDHLLQMGITWAEVIEIYVYSDKHMDQTTVVSKVIITCHYSSSKWHIDIVGMWQYLSKHLKTKPSKISFAQNLLLGCQMILKFCREHGVITPYNEQNFKLIWKLKWKFWANVILLYLSLW